MKTIYVVHCCNACDSAWVDRVAAEARAAEMGMRVAVAPMPDYGEALSPPEPPSWNGCPPGWTGGSKAPL